MLGAGLLDQGIGGLRPTSSLQPLLQCGLVISNLPRGSKGKEVLKFRPDDLLQNNGAGGFQPSIQIDGAKHRLECIHQKCGLCPTATFFFAAAQAKILPQFQTLGDVDQVILADEMSAQLRELTLAELRKAAEELLGGDQTENGVP